VRELRPPVCVEVLSNEHSYRDRFRLGLGRRKLPFFDVLVLPPGIIACEIDVV
jgi:hypothetical protein